MALRPHLSDGFALVTYGYSVFLHYQYIIPVNHCQCLSDYDTITV